jgi:hypothetical protein
MSGLSMSGLSMSVSAWQDVRRIWTVATTRRSPQAVKWGGRLALLLALAFGMAKLGGLLPRTGFWKGELLIAVGWFTLMWMGLFLPASVLMNSAPNARLVPRLRRRLLQMGAGSWVLATGGATLAFGTWSAYPLFAAYMLGITLQRAGFRSAAALVVLAPLWPLMSARLPAPLTEAVTSTPGLLALSALLVLGAAWGLVRLYPAGGDRHLDGRGQVVERIGRTQNPEIARSRGVAWLNRFAYLPALQRDCLLGKPGTLLLHALGPVVHWSAWIPGLAIIVLFTLALGALLAFSGAEVSPDVAHGVLGTVLVVLTSLVVLGSAKFGQALRTTQGEQALLRLTPLTGQAALLNRRLADAMTKTALFDWAMMTAVLLIAAWVAGADGAVLLRQFALSCLAGMLAVTGLLGDFARSLPAVSWRQSLMVILLCSGGATLQWMALGSLFWVGLALASLSGAALLLRAARRRMLAAPPAFPAERMESSLYGVKQ